MNGHRRADGARSLAAYTPGRTHSEHGPLLHEQTHLRRHRRKLREEWLWRITDAELEIVMTPMEKAE